MFIVKAAIVILYFNISGLATTNILRLLKGNTLHIYSSKCFCTVCEMKITPINQMPIFSYIACKGKCKKCKTALPLDALILELLVFVGMTSITLILNFSKIGVALSFCFYEFLRVSYIVKYGRRETGFYLQYILALFGMMPHFLVIECLAYLLKAL